MRRYMIMISALACFLIPGCGSDGTTEPSVRVFKSRGSLQCTGGGTAPEIMKNDLIAAGIDVRSFSCGMDGLAYPAVCGAPDGAINIFDIPQGKITEAQSLGFASLSTLPAPLRT